MSSPIRVGILGLGKGSGDLVPGLWAAKAHLPYFLASPNYEVVAVANSTAQSAQSSIDFHQLGPKVKAYGSPEDIANDPNVEMVVVSVKVGMHNVLTKPALLAGPPSPEEPATPLPANVVITPEIKSTLRTR